MAEPRALSLCLYTEKGPGILDKESLLQCVERVLEKRVSGLFKDAKRGKEHS